MVKIKNPFEKIKYCEYEKLKNDKKGFTHIIKVKKLKKKK
jgi:hypothetical protein